MDRDSARLTTRILAISGIAMIVLGIALGLIVTPWAFTVVLAGLVDLFWMVSLRRYREAAYTADD